MSMICYVRYFLWALVAVMVSVEGRAQFAYTPHLNINPERIDIVRDSFGVPHIFAKTDAEVAYGLAWATAEDDEENAQFMLCAMRGMLGRKLGVDGAKVDFAVKFLGVMDYVDTHYEKEIPDDLKRVLEGYCDGVNAYLLQHPEKIWFKKLLPVRPQDIVAGYMLSMALMGGIEGTVSAMAGEAILFNHQLIHGSSGNYSGEPRLSVIMPVKSEAAQWQYYYAPSPGQPLEKYFIDFDSYYKIEKNGKPDAEVVGYAPFDFPRLSKSDFKKAMAKHHANGTSQTRFTKFLKKFLSKASAS